MLDQSQQLSLFLWFYQLYYKEKILFYYDRYCKTSPSEKPSVLYVRQPVAGFRIVGCGASQRVRKNKQTKQGGREAGNAGWDQFSKCHSTRFVLLFHPLTHPLAFFPAYISLHSPHILNAWSRLFVQNRDVFTRKNSMLSSLLKMLHNSLCLTQLETLLFGILLIFKVTGDSGKVTKCGISTASCMEICLACACAKVMTFRGISWVVQEGCCTALTFMATL